MCILNLFLVFRFILRIGHRNVHLANAPINIRRVHGNVKNYQFPKKAEDKSKNSSNPTNDLLNCPKHIIPKALRFAKEFIKLSSIRYKLTKTYSKQCIDTCNINERKKCQIPCSETDFSTNEHEKC